MKSDAILFSPAIQSQTKIAKCDQLFKFPKTHSLPIHCGSPRAHTLSNHSPPPHFAGRSLTLRVVFYLPERCRDCETTGRRDSRTPIAHNTSPLPLCGSFSRLAGRFLPTRALSRLRDDETAAPRSTPHTLRVFSLLRCESTTKIAAARCGCAALCCA